MEPGRAAELMESIARDQDRAAFAELFQHYAPQIKRYLMRGGASASAAEEITQEVMVIIWRKAARFDRRRSSVNTWVFTIARNKRIDRFRRERRPEYDPDDPLLVTSAGPEGDARVAASQREEKVRAALAELPPEQAAILEAAYFGGQSLRVISEDLGVPLGTVKSRIRLAMKRLRGALDQELI